MGTITGTHRALAAVIIAAGFFAGCASASNFTAPSVQAQHVFRVATSGFAGEAFTSTYVKAACLLTPGGPEIQYTASGQASGPYPGTFTASGSVFDFAIRKTITFTETFDVYSSSQTYSGSAQVKHGIKFPGCEKNTKSDLFVVKKAPYKVDGSRGKTEVHYSKTQLSETFH